MSSHKKEKSVADQLDRAAGYVVAAAVFCAVFFLLPLQTVLAVLIAVVVWLVRWKRNRESARQMVEDYNRRRSGRQVRLNPSKGPKKRGKLKHYSPTLMPLSLSKAVRTVAPQARETERRLPPLHIGLSATGRAGSGREKAPR